MKLRVVHVISADMGVRFILLNQLLFLKNKGYEVTAVCSDGKWVKYVQEAGIPVKIIEITRNLNPYKDLLSLWRLFRYFRSEGFSLVHTHTPKAGFVGRIAAKMARIPVIIHTNPGFYFHENSGLLSRIFYVLLEKIAASCCDFIFCQNSEDVETAVRVGICEASKIKCIGNGVDISHFNPDQYSSGKILAKKKELGIPSTSRVVGFVGRLVREKGVIEFLEAADIVTQKIPDVRFLAVGPLEPEKSDRIQPSILKQLGHGKDVIMLAEMRTDIPDLLALMDIVTLPSYREGMPRLPMEAGLMKKPVVATNIRGCREVVKNGQTGILIPLKDSKNLAKAIIYMFGHPEEAQKMGINGRKRVKELFDEKEFFPRIEVEYQKLIKEKIIDGMR
jgi:glycosyltransferase involved in cell wall biosynthesis